MSREVVIPLKVCLAPNNRDLPPIINPTKRLSPAAKAAAVELIAVIFISVILNFLFNNSAGTSISELSVRAPELTVVVVVKTDKNLDGS